MLRRILALAALLAVALISGCATSPPSRPEDLCEIFEEKDDWYEAADESRDRWGVPIPVMMSIIYQESGFRGNAKAPYARFLGFIPMPYRVSSAEGYSQALDGTWDVYQDEAGSFLSSRGDFEDSVDFVGWYCARSNEKNGIDKADGYNLYLAYHEGWGGYSRGTYRRKDWLINTARKVDDRAKRYQQQLSRCEDNLDGGWF